MDEDQVRDQSQQEHIDGAEAEGDLGLVINGALRLATEIGYGVTVCELLHRCGWLLCRLNGPHRADELEEALEALEAALEVAVAGEQAARILMSRGLAYGERVKGDPQQNIDRAIDSLRDGLAQLKGYDDGEVSANDAERSS